MFGMKEWYIGSEELQRFNISNEINIMNFYPDKFIWQWKIELLHHVINKRIMNAWFTSVMLFVLLINHFLKKCASILAVIQARNTSDRFWLTNVFLLLLCTKIACGYLYFLFEQYFQNLSNCLFSTRNACMQHSSPFNQAHNPLGKPDLAITFYLV